MVNAWHDDVNVWRDDAEALVYFGRKHVLSIYLYIGLTLLHIVISF